MRNTTKFFYIIIISIPVLVRVYEYWQVCRHIVGRLYIYIQRYCVSFPYSNFATSDSSPLFLFEISKKSVVCIFQPFLCSIFVRLGYGWLEEPCKVIIGVGQGPVSSLQEL